MKIWKLDVVAWAGCFLALGLADCRAAETCAERNASAAKKIDVLCVYYPHWHRYPKGDEWFGADRWKEGEWCFVKDAKPRFPGHCQPIVPTLGYLDESDPADMAKEIAMAADAGIDVFLYDYYYYNGEITQEEALERGFLGAANRRRMKFALMWCYHDRNDQFRPEPGSERRRLMSLAHTKEEFLGLVDVSIKRYFPREEYYRKDGKLFFSIFGFPYFLEKRGSDPARVRAELDEARRRVRAAGLGEVHFNAQGVPPSRLAAARDCGFDSVTEYLCTQAFQSQKELDACGRGHVREIDYADCAAYTRRHWAEMAKGPLPYIPQVSTGWDSTPRCRPDAPYPWRALEYPYILTVTNNTPALFKALLADAKRFAENDPHRPGAIYINGWNEYTEGTYLVPDNHTGDARLKAVAEVFGRTPGDAFTIERNDSRAFRVVMGPDETPATRKLRDELAAEIERVTGVKVQKPGYATAFEGDFYVSTQPWAAKGAWHYEVRNGVLAVHGSDLAGTEAALRDFLDRHVKNVPTSAGRFDWTGLAERHGPQWEDVADATLERVRRQRTQERAPEWENELVNYVNVEPARAYSFPLAKAEDALTPDLPATPFVKSLNGTWKYNWCGTPAQRPPDFWKVGFDDSTWYDIAVPSCVEMKGFGVPIYTNIPYPHPAKPPYTDRDYNPVSSYRTTFTVPPEWKDRNVYLRFEGVYSAYYVWVNGQRVGYSEDSCTAHEFNITPYLNPSNPSNLLCVEVYRWSDGAYLEDQDFFRYSGIYRNVMLFATPRAEIWDFHVRTDLVNNYRDATIDLTVTTRGEKAPVSATLYDAANAPVLTLSPKQPSSNSSFIIYHSSLPQVRLWSAEDPYLYTLVLSNGADVRSCKVGFRKVEEVPGGAILFNGRKIKFKGVNRHDASPENGRSVTREEMLRDVMLMKQYNIDTVRTSHYPNDPYFYHLCERYGIYVQAEANVESHGLGYGTRAIAAEPSWVSAHVDRCRDMVLNWRNSPCVFSWSWGNEAGHGQAFDRITEACRPLEPTLPMQYRQDCERFNWDGPGYPSMAFLLERARCRKTQFCFEYAHCMGNALGNFKEYWDAFYRHDSLVGGCIWDWVDQAVWKETDRLDANGKRIRYLAYGGDHDEKNDGNFCCNGIIDAERNVTPKLIEVAHVHRNLVVSKRDDGSLELWNRFLFTRADAFDGAWELLEDGRVVRSGTFAPPPVEPLSRGTLALDVGPIARDRRERLLNVSFRLKRETLWAKKGWTIARDQIVLGDRPWPVEPPAADAGVRVERTADGLVVTAGPTKAAFRRATGTICELTLNGRTVMRDADGIVHGPRLTCMRAMTDNDIWLRGREGDPSDGLAYRNIYQSGLTQLRYHVRELKPVAGGVRAVIEVNGAKGAGFTHAADYLFDAEGRMTIANEVTPFGRMPEALPRLGLTMALEPPYENLTYYGRGPWENYVDRCSGSFLGVWQSTVTDQYVAYVRPQDNGYKTDVRWAALADAEGRGVKVSGSVPLFLQALHYTWEDLEFARHRARQQRFENRKPPRPEVWVNLDLRQLGLGGASCGPKPEEPYIFPIQPEKWTVTFEPCKGIDASVAL